MPSLRRNHPADDDYDDYDTAVYSPPLKKAKKSCFDLKADTKETGSQFLVPKVFVCESDFGIDMDEFPEMLDVPMEYYDWSSTLEELFGSDVKNQDPEEKTRFAFQITEASERVEEEEYGDRFFHVPEVLVSEADFGIDLDELPEMCGVPKEFYDWTSTLEELFGSDVNQDPVMSLASDEQGLEKKRSNLLIC